MNLLLIIVISDTMGGVGRNFPLKQVTYVAYEVGKLTMNVKCYEFELPSNLTRIGNGHTSIQFIISAK